MDQEVPVQIPLGTQPDWGTQPCCEAPSDLWVKHRQNAVINIGWVKLSPHHVYSNIFDTAESVTENDCGPI